MKVLVQKRHILPLFHAFTGCDTVSSFHGKGKKSARENWKMCPSFTGTLQRLSSLPSSVSDEELADIEQFVVVLYC